MRFKHFMTACPILACFCLLASPASAGIYCGDGSCNFGETVCTCPIDCCAGAPASEAGLCSDGCDNDCDGLTDGNDPDCGAPFCGDGAVDPGEACDGGVGCTDCLCDAGFEPTSPPSLDCQPLCGNGSVDPGEECDGAAGSCPGGVACQDCTCPPPPTGCCWTCDGGTLDCSGPILRENCPPLNLWIEDESCGTNVCGAGKCDDPTGACCDDATGVCTDAATQSDCEGSGNRYGGDGSTCATIDPPCSPPGGGGGGIPTVSQWGIATLALLLLVGAKVYFTRQRTTPG